MFILNTMPSIKKHVEISKQRIGIPLKASTQQLADDLNGTLATIKKSVQCQLINYS